MGKRFATVMLIFIWFWLSISVVMAGDKGKFEKTPKLNSGKKWRIGYLEGGKHIAYSSMLVNIVSSLSDMGWVEKSEIPEINTDKGTSELWKWICSNIKSQYIEFVGDAYWSWNWDANLRKTGQPEVIKRLSKKDIDLIIAMGTWAGQDLANSDHSVATVVCATTNPIQSKIIKSIEDPGFDHIHARVDPTRYERQVRLFHDIIGFKRLGVVYIDSVSGKSYAAIEDIEKIAKERNFEIVRCLIQSGTPEQQAVSTEKCHQDIASKVDAVYITIQGGVNLKSLPMLMEPLNKNKIPTFSQGGAHEVKHGVLMSISQAGYKYEAQFQAETIAKIFNGAKPKDIEQLFEDPPKIAINLAEAKIIGYDPPVDILGVADEIYQEIEVAK